MASTPSVAFGKSTIVTFCSVLLIGFGLPILSLPTAFAAVVAQDFTFGVNGVVVTDIGSGSRDESFDIAVQQDGKILVAGTSAFQATLVRYNDDGSLDTTFADDGIVTSTDSGNPAEGNALAIRSDGRMVVAGTSYTGGSSDFCLFQYDIDGSLDTDFGAAGVVTADPFGTADYGTAVAVQSDGKILLAGHSGNGSSTDFVLLRFNSDGTPDTDFGDGGVVTYDFDTFDEGRAVGIQSDGKIVAAVYTKNFNFSLVNTKLIRFNADGSPDTSFDGDGIATGTSFSCSDMALQSDGKILVSGSKSGNIGILRYEAGGSPDETFGDDGEVSTDVGNAYCQSMAVRSDGKIVLAGYIHGDSYPDFLVLRYNADGSLDTTYGSGGVVIADNNGLYDLGEAVAVQSDGKILVTGSSTGGPSIDFALLRFFSANVDATGDVDKNGSVDLSDAILLLKVLSSLTAETVPNPWADVNLDNHLDVSDVIYILQSAAGQR